MFLPTVENVGVSVFLVSLKAGGVALNLVEASRVYIMDPWWNRRIKIPFFLYSKKFIRSPLLQRL